MSKPSGVARFVAYLWAVPCTLVGLLLACPIVILGARCHKVRGVLEVGLAPRRWPLTKIFQSRCVKHLPFSAITFGHVIIGLSQTDLDDLREHEHAHVRQYEQWGLLFFLAYPGSSAVQWLSGKHPYRDNFFEVQARLQEALRGENTCR